MVPFLGNRSLFFGVGSCDFGGCAKDIRACSGEYKRQLSMSFYISGTDQRN